MKHILTKVSQTDWKVFVGEQMRIDDCSQLEIVKPGNGIEIKTIPLCERELWKKYRRLCWKITEKQNIKKLPNYCNRGFKNYHLDHKVSIWYGYKNKIDPKLIGSIDNLEFIPCYENQTKGIKCNFKGAKPFQLILFIE
jgi:hypothetical protein